MWLGLSDSAGLMLSMNCVSDIDNLNLGSRLLETLYFPFTLPEASSFTFLTVCFNSIVVPALQMQDLTKLAASFADIDRPKEEIGVPLGAAEGILDTAEGTRVPTWSCADCAKGNDSKQHGPVFTIQEH